MPHQHRHAAPEPEVRYLPAPRPHPMHGILWDLVGTVLRMVVVAAVAVLILAGAIVGLLALVGKGVEMIPDQTTTSGP